MSQTSNTVSVQNAIAMIKVICDASDGRSQLFFIGGSGYKASVTHYYGTSTNISACAVQPGSVKDLQSIVKVIAETRAPFAVKCGGHSTNPGFSSTKGIQICLGRFNKIVVHEGKKLVDVGSGCLFEEIYRALAPHGLGIVGGSGLSAVGLSGWLLGGGYSNKTNLYGLGIDNVESAKLVLPDGTFKEVSAEKDKDLFFAIKGGGNNFGIITEFTLKAHTQEKYYLFQLAYEDESNYGSVKLALVNFNEKAHSKAHLKVAFNVFNTPEGTQKFITVLCAYHGSYPQVDPFKELRAIKHTLTNYGEPLPKYENPPSSAQSGDSLTTTSGTSHFYAADILHSLENETYDLSHLPEDLEEDESEVQFNIMMCGQLLPITEFVGDGSLPPKRKPKSVWNKPPARSMAGISQFPRGRWGTVMVNQVTLQIINEIEKQTIEAAKEIKERRGRRVQIDLWPYTKAMFDKATPAAWPHEKGHPNFPIIVSFTWERDGDDKYWIDTLKSTLKSLRQSIHELSPSSKELPCYLNTALAGETTVQEIYRGNLEKLSELRERYDPKRVMDLTGGFRIPFKPVSGQ